MVLVNWSDTDRVRNEAVENKISFEICTLSSAIYLKHNAVLILSSDAKAYWMCQIICMSFLGSRSYRVFLMTCLLYLSRKIQ